MSSIAQELNTAGFSGKQERALNQLFNDIRLQFLATDTIAAKLDADAGVTDTNFAALLATARAASVLKE